MGLVMSAILLRRFLVIAAAILAGSSAVAEDRRLAITPFVQAVAEAAASDREVAAFYRETGYQPIWTGDDARSKERREAFLRAVEDASAHGLPAERYRPDTLAEDLRNIRSDRELGRAEVALSKLFLQYAQDIQTGLLVPGQIDSGIVREVPRRDRTALLSAF